MSRSYALRVYLSPSDLEPAVSALGRVLYVYADIPAFRQRRGWVFVRRAPGLDGLIDALKFGLQFAPELLGFEASIVEVFDVEELELLRGLSPSSLGQVFAVFRGSREELDAIRARRLECGGVVCYELESIT